MTQILIKNSDNKVCNVDNKVKKFVIRGDSKDNKVDNNVLELCYHTKHRLVLNF